MTTATRPHAPRTRGPKRPAATGDPLDQLLRAAVRKSADRQVRAWLRRIAGGDTARSAPVEPARPAGAA